MASLTPRIRKPRTITVTQWEVAALPQRCIEVGVQHLQQPSIDICEEILLTPFQPKCVKRLSVGAVQSGAFDVSPPPCVVGAVRSPMERRARDVVAALSVCVVVATRFKNVDFAGLGPRAVDGFGREHPDGGPEPVACGKAGGDFNATIGDGGAFGSVETAGFDRVDDCAVGGVGRGDAVGEDVGGADAAFGEVNDAVVVD